MTAVKKIAPHLNIQCPDFMRPLKAWLVWRFETRPGDKKPRKVPYYVSGGRRLGRQGSPEDRDKLVTFDAALAAAIRGGFDGVGIAILDDLDVQAIDYDNVVQDAAILEQVKIQVAGTYAEFSPSGNGVRAFVRRTDALANIKSHAKEGHAFTFEVFSTSGFVTFTGNVLPDSDLTGADNFVAPAQPALLELYRQRLEARGTGRGPVADNGGVEPVGYGESQLRELLAGLNPSCPYEQWIETGMAVHHETEAEGFEIWHEWSMGGDDYQSEGDCRYHWDSFGRRPSGAVKTIRTLVMRAKAAGVSIGGPVASADDFDDIEDTPEEVAQRMAKVDRFRFMSAASYAAMELPGWIVDNLIPNADLVIFYGPSQSGKSFVLIDICMAIARGVPWRGLDVAQGRVAYICAEGGGGFRKRLRAYAQHHQVDLAGVPFEVMGATPNFLVVDDVKAVQAAIAALQGVKVIIVDTWAKVTAGGNENAGEDMGKALDNCRRIAAGTGACVILVHHTGKDVERGARGWSGLRAAADAEFEVVRDEAANKRWLQTTKQKDGDDEGRWGFSLEKILIGMTDKGKEITSCVIFEDQAPTGGRKGKKVESKKLKEWPAAVMAAFTDLQGVSEGPVTLVDLIAAAADKRPEAGALRHRKSNAKRAIEGLAKGRDALLIIEKSGPNPLVFEVQE
jgi:sugar phosphate isomerase/epimerase